MTKREEQIAYILKNDKSQVEGALKKLSDSEIAMLKVKMQMKNDKPGHSAFHKGNTLRVKQKEKRRFKRR